MNEPAAILLDELVTHDAVGEEPRQQGRWLSSHRMDLHDDGVVNGFGGLRSRSHGCNVNGLMPDGAEKFRVVAHKRRKSAPPLHSAKDRMLLSEILGNDRGEVRLVACIQGQAVTGDQFVDSEAILGGQGSIFLRA